MEFDNYFITLIYLRSHLLQLMIEISDNFISDNYHFFRRPLFRDAISCCDASMKNPILFPRGRTTMKTG